MKSKLKMQRRQLTFPVVHPGLDLEPLMRGAVVSQLATLQQRPPDAEQLADTIPLDDAGEYVPPPFVWPKVGAAVVHYPLGGRGPRVEHPPGIVCDLCQWQADETGFPVGAFGREPHRFCNGCSQLQPRRRWHVSAGVCRQCSAVRLKPSRSCPAP